MGKEIESEKKEKPAYDEQTLADVLEAAYVLQEHNRSLKQAMESRVEPLIEPNLQSGKPDGSQSSPADGSPAGLTESDSRPPAVAAQAIVTPDIPDVTPSKDDYTPTLAQIVETQHQIQQRHLQLNEALALVAERVAEIAHAGGAAVGIANGNKMVYRAVSGQMTLPQGTEVPLEKTLGAASFKTGHVIRCMHVNSEFLIDPEECRQRGIRSLIVVPVYHDGGVAGALELYYPKAEGFTEPDVHTSQLMAGLITEALARADEISWKKSLADERAVMLDALEKLKPNLAALLDASVAQKSEARTSETKTVAPDPKIAEGVTSGAASAGVSSPGASAAAAFVCRKCGHQFAGQEQFCGKCGLPRSSSSDYEPPNMQSKVASLWHMQEAMKRKANAPSAEDDAALAELTSSLYRPTAESSAGRDDHPLDSNTLHGTIGGQLSPQLAKLENLDDPALDSPSVGNPALDNLALDNPALNDRAATTLQEVPAGGESSEIKQAADWSSAATARDFLERLANRPGGIARFWNARRGDVYLAIAVILVAVVVRWGIWSNHSVGASGNQYAAAPHRKPAPDSDLSMFDRMLISLGLAEAPEPPESKGNAETQVWVDLQTALYYCPGSDLYGKTPKGKFETQRDAQLDQFESASRKACN
jgi:GAF domain-containing protein/ribosomal protein L37E